MAKDQLLTFERPLVSVDVAIFSVQRDALHVLLVKRPSGKGEPFPGAWALPGGFVNVHEDVDLESCALRKLKEKTGVTAPYLEQVAAVGSAQRDPRAWSTTHVYFALVGADDLPLSPGGNASEVQWFLIDGSKLKETLAFDHAELLKSAIARLRNKVEYTSLPAFLMPAEFTLTELQQVYEVVLDRTLEKKAFRTRMLAADLLEPLAKQKEGPNRPAQLFRLKSRKRPVYFARTFGRSA
jgi:ADP-ribose pyrophosphatase YjhB (NUDIX family)